MPIATYVCRLFTTQFAACVAALVMLLVAFTASPANAQGTMGTVPDPISSRELEGYGDRLGLSDQQRQAVLAAHDVYRDEFRTLRETDIEKLLEDARGLQGGAFGMLNDRAAVEKGLKSLDMVMDKIKAVDNRFFDQLQTVLTDEQLLLLPRVRQARERQRYQSGLTRFVGFLNPASQQDLSAILLDFDLAQQEKQSIDPILVSYESTLTAAARKLHDGTMQMVVELLDRMQAMMAEQAAQQQAQDQNAGGDRDRGRGRGPGGGRNPGFDNFRQVWSEVSIKQQEKAAVISGLNRRTLRDLTPNLTADHATRLRSEYFGRAYPEVSDRQGSAAKAFRVALDIDELTDEQRQSITALATDYRANADRVTDQMVDVIDDQRKTTSFLDFDSEQRRKTEERLNGLREQRRAINTTAMDGLKAALGPDLAGSLDRRVAEAKDDKDSTASRAQVLTMSGPAGVGFQTAARVAVNVGPDNSPDAAPMADPYLPGPITARNIEMYSRMLDLSDDQRTVLDSVHEEYRSKFSAIEESEVKAVREASQGLWTMGEGGQFKGPTPDAVDNLYALRHKTLQSIETLDNTFFEDVQTTVLQPDATEKLARLKLARQRDVYNRGDGGSFLGLSGMNRSGRGGGDRGSRGGQRGMRGLPFLGGGATEEASIDLSSLVDQQSLTAEDRAKADPVLVDYERSLAGTFKKRYEASIKMQQSMDKMMAQTMQTGASGGGDSQRRMFQTGGEGFRRVMETDGRTSREATSEAASLNKATLNRLIEALPSQTAETLRLAYNKRAYPNIYQDSRSAETRLTEAMKLDDLSSQQQSQIAELLTTYRTTYDGYCEQLVKLNAAQPDLMGGGGGQRDWQGFQDRQREMEKVTFDRDDLSDKTIAKLRAVLTDEQTQRIGGLKIEKTE